MKRVQILDRLGGNEGRVAREHNDLVIRGKRIASDHEGVASATLFGLQDKVDARVANRFPDPLRFMADDDEDVGRRDDSACGGDDMRQDGLAGDLMQNFGVPGFETRALSGRHDCDGHAGCWNSGRSRILPGGLWHVFPI